MKFFVNKDSQFQSIIFILFLSLTSANLIFYHEFNEYFIEISSLILVGVVSKADLMKKELHGMFDQDAPLKLSSDRTNKFKEICNKFRWDYEKTRTTIQKAFKQVVKERKLNPSDYGIGNKIPRYVTDMDAQITPELQPGAVEPKVEQTQTTTTVAPVTTPRQIQNFDEKGVAASFNAIFLMFRLAYPDLELLTEDEKDALGRMWLPAFTKYLTEKWAIIGVPTIATLGIFLSKIIKARKIKKEKEKEEKETKQSQQKEPKKKYLS